MLEITLHKHFSEGKWAYKMYAVGESNKFRSQLLDGNLPQDGKRGRVTNRSFYISHHFGHSKMRTKLWGIELYGDNIQGNMGLQFIVLFGMR